MARIPKAEIQAQIAKVAPTLAVPPVKSIDVPEDIGAALYTDRAGPPINTGLTEGASNLATITADARRAVAAREA